MDINKFEIGYSKDDYDNYLVININDGFTLRLHISIIYGSLHGICWNSHENPLGYMDDKFKRDIYHRSIDKTHPLEIVINYKEKLVFEKDYIKLSFCLKDTVSYSSFTVGFLDLSFKNNEIVTNELTRFANSPVPDWRKDYEEVDCWYRDIRCCYYSMEDYPSWSGILTQDF